MNRLIELALAFFRWLTRREVRKQQKVDDAIAQAAIDRPTEDQTEDALRKGKF